MEGGPSRVGGNYWCNNNNLISLEGGPTYFSGQFDCDNNPISQIYKLFPNHKSFMDSLDYDYLRGTSIIKWKFQEALEEAGIEMLKRIAGWNWIQNNL